MEEARLRVGVDRVAAPAVVAHHRGVPTMTGLHTVQARAQATAATPPTGTRARRLVSISVR